MVSYKFSPFVPPLKCLSYDSDFYYSVDLGFESKDTQQYLWSSCGNELQENTFVVSEGVTKLFVQYFFYSLYHPTIGRVGFRFLFSFHNRSALLSRMSDGRWNCSVLHWADFLEHFPCDLETDCVHGEDELGCLYTNVSRCGAGAISMGESCYFYVISENDVSWNDAMDICKKNDAQLASLNRPREWHDVMVVLGFRAAAVYLGLRSASLSLPY